MGHFGRNYDDSGPDYQEADKMTDEPNILLVILDSARAQNMSVYGYERDTTPYLERLSEQATLYTQARAPARWSLPSHVSIFTGYHTAQHGITDERYRFDGPSVWDTLSGAGYETGVFSYNVFLTDESFGLRDEFDHVVGQLDAPYEDGIDPKDAEGYVDFLAKTLRSPNPHLSVANGLATKLRWMTGSTGRNDGSVYVDAFDEWTDTRDGPWAACINLMDTHFPYVPRSEYNNWGTSAGETLRDNIDTMSTDLHTDGSETELEGLVGLYDGTIRQADALVERLVGCVDLDSTLLAVMADHGEGFGEPNRIGSGTPIYGHAYGLHECQLHVPLLVRPPQGAPATRIEQLATLTRFPDVAESYVSNDDQPADFTVDEAYASTHKVHHANRLKNSILEQFEGETFVLYDSEEGKLRKHIRWNDNEVSLQFDGDSVTVNEAEERVSSAFDSLQQPPCVRSEDEVSEATVDRLQELGYL